MASTYLTFAPSDSTDVTSATLSMWFKRSKVSSGNHTLFNCSYLDGSTYFFRVMIDSNDNLQIENVFNTTTDLFYKTNRVFRDTSAWYHLTIKLNLSETGNDRCKVYINGTQETSFSTQTAMTGSQFFSGKSSFTVKLGNTYSGTSNYFDGLMSHVNYTYNNAYDADTFGETDATTGIWKPKTAPSVTYGTNGFFLKFENSGAFGTDSSGNGNNFTVNGTMTQTIDTPSNVFATFNHLARGTNVALSLGNTKSENNRITNSGNVSGDAISTLAVSSGKYYAEFKLTTTDNYSAVGVVNSNFFPLTSARGYGYSDNVAYRDLEGNKYVDGTDSSYGADYGAGDIIGIALNLDDDEITFYKNGVSQGVISKTFSGSYYFFTSRIIAGTGGTVWEANFGNGYFGTTAVASAQNPDDGIGIFEHSVPNGYKALCTKSINSQEYD